MKILKTIILILVISVSAGAQGVVNTYENRLTPSLDQTGVFLSSGFGSSIGMYRLKNLSPRTSVLIGASYTNYRISAFNNESNYFPISSTSLRTEFQYYLTPKDQLLTAFVYGALNNNWNTFNRHAGFNLGLEAGGEVRYKIADNMSFFIRTSVYRGNIYGDPYMLQPYFPSR